MTAVRRGFLGFWSLLVGMSLTFRHMFHKPNTLHYPDETWDLPKGAKGQLHNVVEDCIGCMLCARNCPVDCFAIECVKAPRDVDLGKTSNDMAKKLYVLRFDIDMAKCCYCALCTYPCPTECLTMKPEYENSVYSRDNLVYHYADPSMTPERMAEIREEAGGKSTKVGM